LLTPFDPFDFTHQENPYEDYDLEPMLPHRFSRQGPCVVAGDVDGDGLDDLFLGGPARTAGTLFLQRKGGSFLKKEMPDPGYEDAGAALFDADGDGDLDLYVVSGGSEYNPLTATYQDRLYFNDGRGNFTRQKAALPVEYASGSCVVPQDFDGDGDLDLFVGGRLIPTRYPQAAESFLLRNDGRGNFTDVTEEIAPNLKESGMVTAAAWADANGDRRPDLLVVGEWMAPQLYLSDSDKLVRSPQPALDSLKGWYLSAATLEANQDGRPDFVVGNLGLNSRWQVSKTQPLRLYANDLDQNGRIELLLTQYIAGDQRPVFGREHVAMQYPLIKKKYPTYTDYANATMEDLINPSDRANSLIMEATDFRSFVLLTDQDKQTGTVSLLPKPLPRAAQVSPIRSILVLDFGGDGIDDLITGGNWFSPDYRLGRFDAAGGQIIRGSRNGDFRVMPPSKSGYLPRGEAALVARLVIGGKPAIVAGQNSDELRAWYLPYTPNKGFKK